MIKTRLTGRIFAGYITTFILCACTLQPLFAQNMVNPAIQLNGITITDAAPPAVWLGNNSRRIKLPAQVLLEFSQSPSTLIKEQLQVSGVTLHDYLPGDMYTATFNRLPSVNELQTAGVKRMTTMQPGWKMSTGLKPLLLQQLVDVEVSVFFYDFEESAIKEKLNSLGATMIADRLAVMNYCNINIPANNVMQLAQWHQVSYIDIHRADEPLNTYAKAATRGHVAALPVPLGGYGLKGEGITIGVGDNTSGVFHVDLADRIINYNPQGYTNHGVHINGIVGGAGIVDPKGEGIAPEATLTNHYFSDVLVATPEIFAQHNAVVTNNSYSASSGSCSYSGTYDGISVALDNLCNNYKNVFQVFAAANDGEFDCQPFPKGFATIAGGYQPAKNNIVVASTDKEYVNAFNSSRGPVKDGRLKPEITAVGVDVISDTKNDEYLVASGTSMACPQVAGVAALLAERMKQLNGTTQPRSDVLKTLLINGAMDIGIPGPDFRFGFGFLDAERSLIMLDSNRYITAAVADKGQNSHAIIVPPNTAQLKVTLCWHDVAASPLATTVLVNDLDLEVTEPNSTLHLPLVLDHTPANILNPAVEKADRLNNTEQVVIQNPAAGNYSITVKGFKLPSGTRDYVLAYDFLPTGIQLKYPLANSQVRSADSVYIYWNAAQGTGNFTLEYSIDNGNVWSVIDNAIPGDKRHYKWMVPPAINSGMCRIRLTRGSDQSLSEQFVINEQPVVTMSTSQCPGYIKIDWEDVPNATEYYVMKKDGPALATVDTVTATEYVFSGLDLNTTYYVTVQPVIDGLPGYRAIAKKRKPTDGNCPGNISDGDIMIEKVVAPVSGRIFTETELSASESLRLQVRNLDDVTHSSYKISYSINGAAWVSQTFTDVLPANAVKTVTVPGLDLSPLGDYEIRVAVENLAFVDNVPANDSTVIYVAQLPNAPVTLDYKEDFESLTTFNSVRDTFGFSTARRWDFASSTDTGRVRSLVLPSVTLNGQRSLSMDASRNCKGNTNTLTGTFNLVAYDARTDEVRVEFDYILHDVPPVENNLLSARGATSKQFRSLYTYNAEVKNIGRIQNSGSLSLSDLLDGATDNFSSSTQLLFAQNDGTLIGGRNVGAGLTIDDIRIYTVKNDVQLLAIVTPLPLECGVTGAVPLVVTVRNGVAQAQNNIKINYRLNGGAVITETIVSLAGKQQLNYTFSRLLDITASGSHNIDVWIVADGDTYNKNDSILNYATRNQPLVTTFPYFEDFEKNDGYWYADGINSSWEYGTPSAPKINRAASGQKAWVTNLDGNYNAEELSYLYTPCFDLSGIDKPVLSFKLALDIENCGAILCDAAYMDYSLDGKTWERLGKGNEGINWYNDTSYLSWTLEDKTAWQHTELPLPSFAGNVQFRFGLHTDPGSEYEGIGIDDFRIFNNIIFKPGNNIISVSPNPATDGVVNIEWGAVAGTEMKVMITDITGRDVYSTSVIAQEGYNKTTLNVPVTYTGMYMMRITVAEKEYISKIVFRRS